MFRELYSGVSSKILLLGNCYLSGIWIQDTFSRIFLGFAAEKKRMEERTHILVWSERRRKVTG